MNREREKEWLEKSYLKTDKPDNIVGFKAKEGSVEERVNNISWRHQIPLKNGQVTNGTKDSNADLQEFELPEEFNLDLSDEEEKKLKEQGDIMKGWLERAEILEKEEGLTFFEGLSKAIDEDDS